MSIVTKRIGKNDYAYLVTREGDKVVHKYLGPSRSPHVKKMVEGKKDVSAVPDRLRYLFWDAILHKIHLKKNATYVIERVLEFGDLEAVNWLQRVYPARKIIDVLNLSRTVSGKSRNFWLLWFDIADE